MNKIALTFDDGPNPFWTLKVADVLDKYGVKGNFFVIGKWAEKYPEIVKEVFRRGHLIGNHSYSHSTEGGDFDRAEKVISGIIGEKTKFIRMPFSTTDYNINSLDYCEYDKGLIIKRVLKSVRIRISMNSIILFHDGSDREEEMENRPKEMFKALPKIIEGLIAKDFKIITLDKYAN